MTYKRYSELIRIPSFRERFEYAKIGGKVGEATFGSRRYLNQMLYTSDEWKHVRNDVIVRDLGCDLAMEGYDIGGRMYIHHLNPITLDDIVRRRPWVLDPENLVCVSSRTHEAIHYGDERLLMENYPVSRSPNDTRLW